jgi:hypothetical protein
MNTHQQFEKFHDDVNSADTQELTCLHDLCHEGVFACEAGVEFVLAVETVAKERGIDEPGPGDRVS